MATSQSVGLSDTLQPEAFSPFRTAQRERIESFLAMIRETGQINESARLTGMNKRTHYDWLESVPGYPEEFQKAWKIGIEGLESEVIRRAKDGWDKPIYQQGALVGNERLYSDRLAEVVLKGNIARYKDAAPAGSGGISIQVLVPINAAAAATGRWCRR